MPPQKKKPKRPVSEETRQKLRDNAHRMIAEKKWGGSGPAPGVTWGQGGQGRNRPIPKAPLLISVLEAVEEQRQPGESVDERRLFALLPRGLRLDHDKLAELVTASLSNALAKEQLPRKFIQSRATGKIELCWRGRTRRRPPVSRDIEIELFDPRPEDFRGYSAEELLDVLVLLSAGHTYVGKAADRGRALIAALIREIGEAARMEIYAREGTNVGSRH